MVKIKGIKSKAIGATTEPRALSFKTGGRLARKVRYRRSTTGKPLTNLRNSTNTRYSTSLHLRRGVV